MQLRTHRRLLVAVAAVLAAAAGPAAAVPASAATGTGAVVGHVVTVEGAPAAGVPIGLWTRHEDAPNRSYSTTTDAAGDYSVADVAPDHYFIGPTGGAWTTTAVVPTAAVEADATATAAVLTVIRPADVHGTVVSSVDGSPIAGASVTAAVARSDEPGISDGGGDATTSADGGFTISLLPGAITVRVASRFRFDAVRRVSLGEGSGYDLGAIALDPAGIVTTSFSTPAGTAIDDGWQAAVVDGCRVMDDQSSACPGVDLGATLATLVLAPGPHTIRYEVRNPVSSTLRHAIRVVDVQAGVQTALAPVVVRADPIESATVRRTAYRRGHAITVRVAAAAYVDDARPHLRTSFRISGHAVVPTSLRWRTEEDANRALRDVLVATFPRTWSMRKTLTVRAIVHGTGAYAGQAAKATTLMRSR